MHVARNIIEEIYQLLQNKFGSYRQPVLLRHLESGTRQLYKWCQSLIRQLQQVWPIQTFILSAIKYTNRIYINISVMFISFG